MESKEARRRGAGGCRTSILPSSGNSLPAAHPTSPLEDDRTSWATEAWREAQTSPTCFAPLMQPGSKNRLRIAAGEDDRHYRVVARSATIDTSEVKVAVIAYNGPQTIAMFERHGRIGSSRAGQVL